MPTFVWKIDESFVSQSLSDLVSKYDAKERPTKSQYELKSWTVGGLVVTLYKEKLVAQGNLNKTTIVMIEEATALPGLAIEEQHARVLAGLTPKQSSLMCPSCKSQSMTIETQFEGLDLTFKSECGHRISLEPPLMMFAYRLMPDLNMLISRSMSRLITMGYLGDFEVVIPEFMIDLVDRIKKERGGIAEELKVIRELESKRKIRLFFVRDNVVHVERDYANTQEDKVILDIAHLTNSILVTADKPLRERAALQQRPCLFVTSSDGVSELAKLKLGS